MKYFKFWTLLIAPVLILSACKKSDNTPVLPHGISYKVNGTLIKTDTSFAQIYTTPMEMYIIGANTQGEVSIELELPDYQTGTYVFGKDKIEMLYNAVDFSNTGNDQYHAINGTITVTSSTATSISGTFQYDAELGNLPLYHIMDGEFNIPVSKRPTQ